MRSVSQRDSGRSSPVPRSRLMAACACAFTRPGTSACRSSCTCTAGSKRASASAVGSTSTMRPRSIATEWAASTAPRGTTGTTQRALIRVSTACIVRRGRKSPSAPLYQGEAGRAASTAKISRLPTARMEPFAKETLPVSLEAEMRRSYLDYAMSVIVGRALPDVRDGLKPVHRRVLFAMRELGNDFNRPYKKSARVVGDVIGKYHPHGDTAVYDTIVRMAQDFSLRYMLVDGQGNFGSVDGDNAAAYRYTECRLDRIASEILADIEKE